MTKPSSNTLTRPTTKVAIDQRATEVLAKLETLSDRISVAKEAMSRIIYGQVRVVKETLITLLAGGHVLQTGVPCLGKTKLVDTLGAVMGLQDRRIQFTPEFQRVRSGRIGKGSRWFGPQPNSAYIVSGVRQTPLLPAVVFLFFLAEVLCILGLVKGDKFVKHTLSYP